MRITLALLLSAMLLGSAQNALADCTDTLYGKAASGYILKDVGAEASDQPVVQGGATRTCGRLSYDLWVSGGLAGDTANEIDLSVYYDDQVGPLKVQLAAQYFFVSLDDSLGEPKDDIVAGYADLSLPVTRGRLTIAPLVRFVQLVGVKDLPNEGIVQPGVRGSFALDDRTTLSADIRHPISSRGYSFFRVTTSLSRQVTERFAAQAGWEDTDQTPSVFWFGGKYNF
ncbi:MAG TPA: hypothetical protein VEA36_02135 [Candidatus Paceibacterota bacterium]|nr:hypothetical protein [Candidatus Paceibacterota bacterium]